MFWCRASSALLLRFLALNAALLPAPASSTPLRSSTPNTPLPAPPPSPQPLAEGGSGDARVQCGPNPVERFICAHPVESLVGAVAGSLGVSWGAGYVRRKMGARGAADALLPPSTAAAASPPPPSPTEIERRALESLRRMVDQSNTQNGGDGIFFDCFGMISAFDPIREDPGHIVFAGGIVNNLIETCAKLAGITLPADGSWRFLHDTPVKFPRLNRGPMALSSAALGPTSPSLRWARGRRPAGHERLAAVRQGSSDDEPQPQQRSYADRLRALWREGGEGALLRASSSPPPADAPPLAARKSSVKAPSAAFLTLPMLPGGSAAGLVPGRIR